MECVQYQWKMKQLFITTTCNYMYIAKSIHGAQGDYKCEAFEYTVQLE